MRHILLIAFWMFSGSVNAQTYFLEDDSVIMTVSVKIGGNDSVEAVSIKIKNKSGSDLFIAQNRVDKFIFADYSDGFICFGTDINYGFISHRPDADQREVLSIKPDSVVSVEIPMTRAFSLTGKKISRAEFWETGKYLRVSYVVTNNPLMFSNPNSVARNFKIYRKNITCFISSETVE